MLTDETALRQIIREETTIKGRALEGRTTKRNDGLIV